MNDWEQKTDRYALAGGTITEKPVHFSPLPPFEGLISTDSPLCFGFPNKSGASGNSITRRRRNVVSLTASLRHVGWLLAPSVKKELVSGRGDLMHAAGIATRIELLSFCSRQRHAFLLRWFAFVVCCFAWGGIAPHFRCFGSAQKFAAGNLRSRTQPQNLSCRACHFFAGFPREK
jgi:hypothetical protein